jgi:DNA-binding transcriptional MerR regulator
MTISAASAKSGCSAPTIRYYEDIGLVGPVGRTEGGRRAYRWPEVLRLTFIRRVRDLGLSLDEVRTLLKISDGKVEDCGAARDLVLAHAEAVRARRLELEALEVTLRGMAQRCDATCANGQAISCTIFDEIAVAEPLS